MKEKERLVVSGLVALMLILWLGFPFHQSARFAGSFWGGMFGVVGGILMVFPALYLFVKRIKFVKKAVTKRISMRTLLTWHIYAGVLGPILVVIHSGHKYESPLGIALTAMTILVVLSGFIGRYLMNQLSQEIREKKGMLANLDSSYQDAARLIANTPNHAKSLQPFAGFFGRLFGSLFIQDTGNAGETKIAMTDTASLLRLSESIADLEFSIKTHETFKSWFGKWLKFHIVISVVLYFLMTLHIWAAVHFGIRWFL